jgi:hypothetical protein
VSGRSCFALVEKFLSCRILTFCAYYLALLIELAFNNSCFCAIGCMRVLLEWWYD